MTGIFKKPLFWIIVLAAVSAGGFFVLRNKKPVYEFVQVQRGNLVQEVSSTGDIKPAQTVELSFEQSGKVAGVYASVGQKVAAGQRLAALENSDLEAKLEKAQASLQSEQAKLAELQRGTRPEEIMVYQAKLDSASVAMEEAKKGLADKIKDGYTKSDDAIRSRTDKLFNNPRTPSAQLIFTLNDAQLGQQVERDRVSLEAILTNWNTSLAGLTDSANPVNYLTQAKTSLGSVKSFLEELSRAVNTLSVSPTLTQTTLDAWKTEIATARTNTATATTNLLAAEEKYNTSQAALALAQRELDLKKAGTTQEDLDVQAALVVQAQAGVKSAEADLKKTVISSPIAGIVTKQDTKAGEIVTQNVALIFVISLANYQIETDIPEVDIAKVQVGNSARVTLDALGSDTVLEARVVKIDPGETLVENVPTYKVTLDFSGEDPRIKSGMTADVDIQTAKKENVLFLPQRAVFSKNNQKLVRVLDGQGKVVEKEVKTGLKGSSGEVEITAGLNEGDKVIVSTK